MCAGSFVRRTRELANYATCLSLRGGLITRKRAIGVAKNELMLELLAAPSNEGLPVTSPEVLENLRYGRWR